MRSVALNRITRIANELARNKPDGHELVKELFEALTEVVREYDFHASPIETAPKEPSRPILLYCPRQGGWELGRWGINQWISARRAEFLEPTHWTEAPAPQALETSISREGGARTLLARLEGEFASSKPQRGEREPVMPDAALVRQIADAQSRLEAALKLPGLAPSRSRHDDTEAGRPSHTFQRHHSIVERAAQRPSERRRINAKVR